MLAMVKLYPWISKGTNPLWWLNGTDERAKAIWSSVQQEDDTSSHEVVQLASTIQILDNILPTNAREKDSFIAGVTKADTEEEATKLVQTRV